MFLCYKEAAKLMINQGTGGKIIGACSVSGYRSSPMLSPYSVTKWSVRGLTQAAAMEWAKYKITVNAYCPGIVGTPMWDFIDEELGKYEGKQKGEVIKENSNKRIALGRTGVPEDVANFVSYLASRDSDYMTGQTIMIDGGIEFS
jgi:meso-butanediol dehydrogenase/(S,S)-butanediol dehydrogenase/diacetyl reductase